MDGVDAGAINLMVTISANYKPLYDFGLVFAALLGFLFSGFVLVLLSKVYVFGTLTSAQFGTGQAVMGLLIGSSLLALSTTMYMVSSSVLDAGGGSLFPPSQVQAGLPADKILGAFAEQTVRIVGFFLGLIGGVQMFRSNLPEGDKQKFWEGFVRLVIGGIMMRARDFGNIIGNGMGDAFFR